MPDQFDVREFKRRVKKNLKESQESFNGDYKVQLNELAGLSRAEIDAIVPGTTDLVEYDKLIVVVKEASRVNIAQAELKEQIEKLGELAMSIAKKVPSLAAIF